MFRPLNRGKKGIKHMPNDVPRCDECGSAVKVERGTYPFRESGLDNVVLKGIEIVRCLNCDCTDPIIPNLDGLFCVLALAIVTSKLPLSGPQVRYLRKYLGMSGEQFARLLHTDKFTLSKWENGATAVGSKSDLLIRAVVLHLGRGLREEGEQAVRAFEQINEESTLPPQRIEVDSETLEYEYA